MSVSSFYSNELGSMSSLGNHEVVFPLAMNRRTLETLCEDMDANGVWEKAASHMPGIMIKDIEGCKKMKRKGKSPSRLLLQVWSAKGYTNNHLYKVFAIIRNEHLMGLIKSTVDPQLYHLENLVSDELKKLRKQREQKLREAEEKRIKDALLAPKKRETKLHMTPDYVRAALDGTIKILFKEVERATNEFAEENIVGTGRFGTVYKAEITAMGGIVAIKRIMSNTNDAGKCIQPRVFKDRIREGLHELRTLSRYRHDNILPIYAYSLDGPDPCLIYPYMSSGTLENIIFSENSTPLTWTIRRNIATGVCRGVNFLHSIGEEPMVHGDIKSSNILLDKHLEPKLGDFGLSRCGNEQMSKETEAKLFLPMTEGTMAYFPPEYIHGRKLTVLCDVFAFGVVLLELSTGLKAYDPERDIPTLNEYCKARTSEFKDRSRWREVLSDPKTPPAVDESEQLIFDLLFITGMLASRKAFQERPRMEHILHSLNTGALDTVVHGASRDRKQKQLKEQREIEKIKERATVKLVDACLNNMHPSYRDWVDEEKTSTCEPSTSLEGTSTDPAILSMEQDMNKLKVPISSEPEPDDPQEGSSKDCGEPSSSRTCEGTE